MTTNSVSKEQIVTDIGDTIRAAWALCNNTANENPPEVDQEDWNKLSAALDKLDQLPEVPDLIAGPATKAEYALTELLSLRTFSGGVTSGEEEAPIAYASLEQLNAILVDHAEEGGTYVPLRKASAGNFKTPLYLHPDKESFYDLGEREGYNKAIQDVDRLTGGDGEYRWCSDGDAERHTPDAYAMKERIVERFAALVPLSQLQAVERENEALREALANIAADTVQTAFGPKPTHGATTARAALELGDPK